ncbi:alkaline phosphatase family protein [bacterium]|nr:alkaline phosphatase family protein [candidate division CSSED10-310 bacterium]
MKRGVWLVLPGAGVLCAFLLLSVSSGCGRIESLPEQTQQVVLYGLDAATWSVAMPMLRQGELPVLERLVADGASGSLRTLYPTVSVVIWTTIATGRLPERHGIFNWTMRGANGEGGQLAITSNMRRCKALWNMTGDAPVLFVNWWASWPAEPVNGAIISNRALFTELDDRTWPASLTKDLDSAVAAAARLVNDPPGGGSTAADSLPAFIARRVEQELQLEEFSRNLAASLQPRLFGIYFRTLDLLQHERWDSIEPEAFEQRAPGAERDTVIRDYYRFFDGGLGRLIGRPEIDTTVILVSDHGMQAITELPPPVEALKLDKLLQAFGLQALNQDGTVHDKASWAVDNGRYPPGLVRGITVIDHPDEYPEATAGRVTGALSAVSTTSGQPLFLSIEPGSGLDDLVARINPDIAPRDVVRIRDKERQVGDFLGFIIHPRAGQHWHAPHGMVVMAGERVRRNVRLQGASVTDIAPTTLRLMSLPAARDMDGKPLRQALQNTTGVECIDSYDPAVSTDHIEPVRSAADEIIQEELRALGYIE